MYAPSRESHFITGIELIHENCLGQKKYLFPFLTLKKNHSSPTMKKTTRRSKKKGAAKTRPSNDAKEEPKEHTVTWTPLQIEQADLAKQLETYIYEFKQKLQWLNFEPANRELVILFVMNLHPRFKRLVEPLVPTYATWEDAAEFAKLHCTRISVILGCERHDSDMIFRSLESKALISSGYFISKDSPARSLYPGAEAIQHLLTATPSLPAEPTSESESYSSLVITGEEFSTEELIGSISGETKEKKVEVDDEPVNDEEAARVNSEETSKVDDEETLKVDNEEVSKMANKNAFKEVDKYVSNVAIEETPKDTSKENKEETPKENKEKTYKVNNVETLKVNSEETLVINKEETPKINNEESLNVNNEETEMLTEETIQNKQEEIQSDKAVHVDHEDLDDTMTPKDISQDVVEGSKEKQKKDTKVSPKDEKNDDEHKINADTIPSKKTDDKLVKEATEKKDSPSSMTKSAVQARIQQAVKNKKEREKKLASPKGVTTSSSSNKSICYSVPDEHAAVNLAFLELEVNEKKVKGLLAKLRWGASAMSIPCAKRLGLTVNESSSFCIQTDFGIEDTIGYLSMPIVHPADPNIKADLNVHVLPMIYGGKVDLVLGADFFYIFKPTLNIKSRAIRFLEKETPYIVSKIE